MLGQYFRTIIFDLRICKSRNDLPDFSFLKLSKRSQLVKMSSKEENFVRIVIPDSRRTSALSVSTLCVDSLPREKSTGGMTYCWLLLLLAFGAAAGVSLVFGAGQDCSQVTSSCFYTDATVESTTATVNPGNRMYVEDLVSTTQFNSTASVNQTTISTTFIRKTAQPETTTALMANSTANRVLTTFEDTEQVTTSV